MRIYVIFLLNLCLVAPVWGGTISGSIHGTLSVSNSPYVVTGDLLINAGDTLRIEPHCQLFFEEATTFKVQGVLLAQGTATDSIYFSSNKSPQNPGDWQGIYFDKPANKSYLSYVVISYASTGITFDSTDSEIKHSCIKFNTNGIDCSAGAQPLIESNQIIHNGNSGIRVTSSSPRIIANKIFYNALEGFDSAIVFNWSSGGLLLQNQIAQNGNSGVDCDNDSNPDIINNTIIDNSGYGISLSYSSPRIINNLVSNNQYGICNEEGSPSISYNDVWQNSQGDFWGCPDSVGVKVTVNSRGDSADVFYNIQVAPALVNEDGLDFTPTSSSHLIDAGDPANPGEIQVSGDAPDIGAIEYSGTVPVELATFQFDGSKLVWSTATEKNNLGFEVQRSVTGVSEDFQTIGFVKGQGTKTSPTFYSFIDSEVRSGKYYYRLKQIDFNGEFRYSWTVEALYHQAENYRLYKNYPNPFNSSTIITFELAQEDIVSYIIYDLNGREVRRLMIQKNFSPGTHQIGWNGRNNKGEQLPSGTYFGQLRTRHFVKTNKLLLVK